MSVNCSTSRKAGNKLIVDQAQSQVRSFFDELKNGTQNYQTIASLGGQIAQEYRGRCILELLQNAHDALVDVEHDDTKQISFVLSTSPEPVLLIGNSGHPYRVRNQEVFVAIPVPAYNRRRPVRGGASTERGMLDRR